MCFYTFLAEKCILFSHLQILVRLSNLCKAGKKSRIEQHQRLLKNMGAHTVVLELLKIQYEQVRNILKNQLNDLSYSLYSVPCRNILFLWYLFYSVALQPGI